MQKTIGGQHLFNWLTTLTHSFTHSLGSDLIGSDKLRNCKSKMKTNLWEKCFGNISIVIFLGIFAYFAYALIDFYCQIIKLLQLMGISSKSRQQEVWKCQAQFGQQVPRRPFVFCCNLSPSQRACVTECNLCVCVFVFVLANAKVHCQGRHRLPPTSCVTFTRPTLCNTAAE